MAFLSPRRPCLFGLASPVDSTWKDSIASLAFALHQRRAALQNLASPRVVNDAYLLLALYQDFVYFQYGIMLELPKTPRQYLFYSISYVKTDC